MVEGTRTALSNVAVSNLVPTSQITSQLSSPARLEHFFNYVNAALVLDFLGRQERIYLLLFWVAPV